MTGRRGEDKVVHDTNGELSDSKGSTCTAAHETAAELAPASAAESCTSCHDSMRLKAVEERLDALERSGDAVSKQNEDVDRISAVEGRLAALEKSLSAAEASSMAARGSEENSRIKIDIEPSIFIDIAEEERLPAVCGKKQGNREKWIVPEALVPMPTVATTVPAEQHVDFGEGGLRHGEACSSSSIDYVNAEGSKQNAAGDFASASPLRAAAEPPGTKNKAPEEKPRVWKKVEEVLDSDDCAKLLADTDQELSDPSFIPKVKETMSNGEALQHECQGLFVLGPSAAGKSHALRSGALPKPNGALTVDGSHIRETSRIWNTTLERAKAENLAGFSNFFDDYVKPPIGRVKKQVVDQAIKNKTNIVIPDTASNSQSTMKMIDKLIAAGYTLKFVGIFADREVCQRRGKNRESEEGKKFSSKNWETSVQAILDIQEHLKSTHGGSVGDVEVFSNTGVIHKIELLQLERMLQSHRAAAAASSTASSAAWRDEVFLLAGVYKPQNDDSQLIELVPTQVGDEDVSVRVALLENKTSVSSFDMTFDVSKQILRSASHATSGWTLMKDAEGRNCLRGHTSTDCLLPALLIKVLPLAGVSVNI